MYWILDFLSFIYTVCEKEGRGGKSDTMEKFVHLP